MSKDDIIDFIEDHTKLVITIGIIIVLFIICLCIRSHNLSKKNQSEPTDIADMVESVEEPTIVPETDEAPKETFVSNVGLQETEEEESEEVVDPNSLKKQEAEKIEPYCKVTGHTVVPLKNMDGSTCKGYLSKVSISDFDTYFGSDLTNSDVTTDSYILVGTEQIKEGDLQSTGWLQANLGNIDGDTAIYFTNLHVIGHLSDERVVLLCSYDWYSAFGLDNTLVVLEDISGTLSKDDFIDGDIVSTIVWAKNIKMKTVNGQNVVQAEFALEK